MENEKIEIKFRAWDRFRNEMQEVVVIDWKIHIIEFKNGSDCLSGDVELMQFTGLKDKNGKEIYDQFIILYGGKLYLVYQCQTGEWRARNKEENLSLFDISNESELRGNIYKNPKLLEDY